jgi:hypothetical protein
MFRTALSQRKKNKRVCVRKIEKVGHHPAQCLIRCEPNQTRTHFARRKSLQQTSQSVCGNLMTMLPIGNAMRVSSKRAVVSSAASTLMCALQIADKRESHIGIAVMRSDAGKSSHRARVRQAHAAFRDEWSRRHFSRVPASCGAAISLAYLLREAAARRQ